MSSGSNATLGYVEVCHVALEYKSGARGNVLALEEVSFAVQPGEFFCIIGPSGCGKSTLLYLIAGLRKATHGELRLDGRPIIGPSPDRGLVFQQYANLPWRTVLDNAELGLKLQGVGRIERRTIAKQYLELVGLKGFESKFPRELSGGMQQRLAIARTLCTRPGVMLMDEPFGALDAQTREDLQEELLKIWEREHKTVIHVTHNIEEAAYLADRILIMTARPGSVRELVTIDIPRPRLKDAERSHRYVEVCNYVRAVLREQANVDVPNGESVSSAKRRATERTVAVK